ncbi:uncharacterized protein LOC116938921 isoform X2 [Petromyzon marinus]|uniref:uncharacterized protein LOC116938921 isoform X2 n=1 Tax=Petromyzon marinus TaxID=7757 RepID=UPI003F70CBB9
MPTGSMDSREHPATPVRATPVRTQVEVTGLLGDGVDISCQFPAPTLGEKVDVDWFYKDSFESCKELPLVSSRLHCTLDVAQGQARLVIMNLGQEDEGPYQCKVQRLSSGEVTSSTTRLVVKDEPRQDSDAEESGLWWLWLVVLSVVLVIVIAVSCYFWRQRSPSKRVAGHNNSQKNPCQQSPVKTLMKKTLSQAL